MEADVAGAWQALEAELDRWQAEGRVATLWWRDDDAVAPSPALDRLLSLGGGAIPMALAVIPAGAEPALARRLAGERRLSVLQHGYAHANHRPPGERAAEFGGDRPRAQETEELARGSDRLRTLFGDRFVACLVPPWNRIDASLVAELAGLGFTGLSAFGSRDAAIRYGLAEVNTHVDPIGWRHGRSFIGESAALARLIEHLADRRRGRVDRAEPTGLLTHHRVHGQELWSFLERLAAAVARHAAVRWQDAAELFAAPP